MIIIYIFKAFIELKVLDAFQIEATKNAIRGLANKRKIFGLDD
jgi:hypothetical protein